MTVGTAGTVEMLLTILKTRKKPFALLSAREGDRNTGIRYISF